MAEAHRYLRPIQRGEYDLVNISLIGHDPITGKSFAQCQAEWRAQADRLQEESSQLRWWQLRRRWQLGQKVFALRSHLGM